MTSKAGKLMKEKEKNFKNVIVCVVCPDKPRCVFFWNEKKISEFFLFSNQASAASDQKIVETEQSKKTSAYLLRKRIMFVRLFFFAKVSRTTFQQPVCLDRDHFFTGKKSLRKKLADKKKACWKKQKKRQTKHQKTPNWQLHNQIIIIIT